MGFDSWDIRARCSCSLAGTTIYILWLQVSSVHGECVGKMRWCKISTKGSGEAYRSYIGFEEKGSLGLIDRINTGFGFGDPERALQLRAYVLPKALADDALSIGNTHRLHSSSFLGFILRFSQKGTTRWSL